MPTLPSPPSVRLIVLLRGINVGRGNRLPMADLRALLEGLGLHDVATLLNSGNAVCTATADGRAGGEAAQAKRVRDALAAQCGLDVPVIVKTAAQWAKIEAGNPLAAVATDPSRLLVAVTQDEASLHALAALAPLAQAPEAFHLGAEAAYLWCPQGVLASRAASALLGPPGRMATSRNWATVLKLSAKLQGDRAEPL